MFYRSTGILVLLVFLIHACSLIPTQSTEEPTFSTTEPVSTEVPLPATETPARVQLPEMDRIIFTIRNPQPFSGREGEPRPDWLGWGAETFTVAPDGSFWIDDTATNPERLLHYDPHGMLLSQVSLENLVVYAFDLIITRDSIWVLDVSSQPPQIIQLSPEGVLRSRVNIGKEIRKQGEMFVSAGTLRLAAGAQGEVLLANSDSLYQMVDESGQVSARLLDALTYGGHSYQTGVYDQDSGRLPILIDEKLFEPSADFFPEADPFLGVNADGSFAVAGYVQLAESQIDPQVWYFDGSGKLLGMARQRSQMFYKDWNHHLAFGPDGAIYQLLSNPDHSVQILRLGFSRELPPRSELPAATPTPLTAMQSSTSTATAEDQARNTLLKFFNDLSNHEYDAAVAHFGGQMNEYARERMPDETTAAYWDYICGFLWCLPVAEIREAEQIDENKFIFHVVFMLPDRTRFEIGACCGGDPAASPPVWQFAYPVEKVNGAWKVMRAPLFTP